MPQYVPHCLVKNIWYYNFTSAYFMDWLDTGLWNAYMLLCILDNLWWTLIACDCWYSSSEMEEVMLTNTGNCQHWLYFEYSQWYFFYLHKMGLDLHVQWIACACCSCEMALNVDLDVSFEKKETWREIRERAWELNGTKTYITHDETSSTGIAQYISYGYD
jgi:hypothetical protein